VKLVLIVSISHCSICFHIGKENLCRRVKNKKHAIDDVNYYHLSFQFHPISFHSSGYKKLKKQDCGSNLTEDKTLDFVEESEDIKDMSIHQRMKFPKGFS
jgi:hypothetical protein